MCIEPSTKASSIDLTFIDSILVMGNALDATADICNTCCGAMCAVVTQLWMPTVIVPEVVRMGNQGGYLQSAEAIERLLAPPEVDMCPRQRELIPGHAPPTRSITHLVDRGGCLHQGLTRARRPPLASFVARTRLGCRQAPSNDAGLVRVSHQPNEINKQNDVHHNAPISIL